MAYKKFMNLTKLEIFLAANKEDPVIRRVCCTYDTGHSEKENFPDTDGRDSMRGLCIALLLGKMVAIRKGLPKKDFKKIPIAFYSTEKGLFTWKKSLGNLLTRGYSNDWVAIWNRLIPKGDKPFQGRDLRSKKSGRITMTMLWSRCKVLIYEHGTAQRPKGKGLRNIADLRSFALALEDDYKEWKPELADDIKAIECLCGPDDASLPETETETPISAQHSQTEVRESNNKNDHVQDHLRVLKTGFDGFLAKAKRTLENGQWLSLFKDAAHTDHKLAQLGVRIGDAQREKEADKEARQATRIKGDWCYLLESTHEVFLSADRRFPEIGNAFDSLVDALEILGQAVTIDKKRKSALSSGVKTQDISEVFPPQRLYLFLLYFTYLRIECPDAPRAQRAVKLLKRHKLFALLSSHPAGINDCFFKFHGSEFFCRKGERFRNRYYQEVAIHKGDTLKTIIRANYIDPAIDFARCLEGLRQVSPWLRTVTPSQKLFPIARKLRIKTVVIGPPSAQNNPYQEQIGEMKRWRDDRNASS